MRNIVRIAKQDFKRVSTSVVAIVIVFGLCVVPCLYAWFNIFSNWDPYGEEATGRLSVAIATQDTGTELLGVKLNVGDKLIAGLSANSKIGWTVVDSKKDALGGLYAGKYYAAIIVDKDFSKGVVSFLTGDLSNPKLEYYVNDKKNAVAPQITKKAKTAVQEQVNATIVKTLTDLVTQMIYISDANGFTPDAVSGKLIDDVERLSSDIGACISLTDACQGLNDASESLLDISRIVLDDTDTALVATGDFLRQNRETLSDNKAEVDNTINSVNLALKQINHNLRDLEDGIGGEFKDIESYNKFFLSSLDASKTMVSKMEDSCSEMAAYMKEMGLDSAAADLYAERDALAMVYSDLTSLEKADRENWKKVKECESNITSDIDNAITKNKRVMDSLEKSVGPDLQKLLDKTILTLDESLDLTDSVDDGIPVLRALLGDYTGTLRKASGNLTGTRQILVDMQKKLDTVSNLLHRVQNNSDLKKFINDVKDSGDLIGEYFASPVKTEHIIEYEIDSYGSGMASFYTVLAIYVGALFCVVLFKTHLRKKDELLICSQGVKLWEEYFGRFAIFLGVALLQSIIVSVGDIYYVGIQCLDPVRFVLACCVTGFTFVMINFALVFALDNIGEAASVIILLLQVAGGGGTFPIELASEPFGTIYPYLPFPHAMNALKECVAGAYGNTYSQSLLTLLAYAAVFMVLGLVLYKPFLKLVNIIKKHKDETGIMN